MIALFRTWLHGSMSIAYNTGLPSHSIEIATTATRYAEQLAQAQSRLVKLFSNIHLQAHSIMHLPAHSTILFSSVAATSPTLVIVGNILQATQSEGQCRSQEINMYVKPLIEHLHPDKTSLSNGYLTDSQTKGLACTKRHLLRARMVIMRCWNKFAGDQGWLVQKGREHLPKGWSSLLL